MNFALTFTLEAANNLDHLKKEPALSIPCKAVQKALGYMETNLKHPGLQTHKHQELSRRWKKDIFEAFAQNQHPGAYRIFWHYGPKNRELTVLAIVPHP